MDKNPFSELPLAPEPTGSPAPMGNLDGLARETWLRIKESWLLLTGLTLGFHAARVGAYYLLVALGEVVGVPLGAPLSEADVARWNAGEALEVLWGQLARQHAAAVIGSAPLALFPGLFLQVVRRGRLDAAALHTALVRAPLVWAVSALATTLTTFGTWACVLPGIVLAYSLVLGQYAAADTRLSVGDSLRYGWRLMDGHRWTLAVQSTIFFLIGLAATLLTCGLGLLPFMSAALLMPALAYVRLSGRTEPGLPDPVLD